MLFRSILRYACAYGMMEMNASYDAKNAEAIARVVAGGAVLSVLPDDVAVGLDAYEAAVVAAKSAGIAHFVYLSVAQPAPVMRAYIEVRQAGEAMIRASGIPATILRPWYVLGPGHWWPYVLLPAYALLERIPATREFALRLGMISLSQMLTALIECIEAEADAVRVLDVRAIRNACPNVE